MSDLKTRKIDGSGLHREQVAKLVQLAWGVLCLTSGPAALETASLVWEWTGRDKPPQVSHGELGFTLLRVAFLMGLHWHKPLVLESHGEIPDRFPSSCSHYWQFACGLWFHFPVAKDVGTWSRIKVAVREWNGKIPTATREAQRSWYGSACPEPSVCVRGESCTRFFFWCLILFSSESDDPEAEF